MSYKISIVDGAGTSNAAQVKTNTQFTAPDQLQVNANFGVTLTVGDILRVRGSTTNDGDYTVESLVTQTRIFKFAEKVITTEGGVGTCDHFHAESTVLQASTAVTQFLAGGILEATGASFITTAKVQVGDVARVLGHPTAARNGHYRITEVISNTQIRVAGATRGVTTPGALGGGGTVVVKVGSWRLDILNEASPSWSAINVAGNVGPDTMLGSDLVVNNGLVPRKAGSPIQVWMLRGLVNVTIDHTNATASNWISERELVYLKRHEDAVEGKIILKSGATATTGGDTIRLGLSGVDKYSTSRGSYWFGIVPQGVSTNPGPDGSLAVKLYGSVISGASSILQSGNAGELIASLVDGSPIGFPGPLTAGAVYTGRLQNSISTESNGFALMSSGVPFSYENVTVTGGLPGVLIGVIGGVIQGLTFGGAVTTPIFQILSSDITVLNPREQYTLSQLFQVFSAPPSVGRLHYTWSPRFVERGGGAIPSAVPVQNLQVRVFSINEATGAETELPNSPYTTSAAGTIGPTGPGATTIGHGVDLERGFALFTGNTDFSHRVIVEGAGFHRINQVFQMKAAKINFDFPMVLESFPYEGIG